MLRIISQTRPEVPREILNQAYYLSKESGRLFNLINEMPHEWDMVVASMDSVKSHCQQLDQLVRQHLSGNNNAT